MMHWQNDFYTNSFIGFNGFGFGVAFVLFLAWVLVWKGLALWRAAHEENKIWFVALLVFNTLGILEILYLFVFSKCKCAICGKGKCDCGTKETKNVEQPKEEKSEAPKTE